MILLAWDETTAFMGKPIRKTYNLNGWYYDALKNTPEMKSASVKTDILNVNLPPTSYHTL